MIGQNLREIAFINIQHLMKWVVLLLWLRISLSSLICEFQRSHPVNSSLRLQRKSIVNELVVAWCEEDLQWLPQQAKSFHKVTLYQKCDSPLPRDILSIPHLSVISMPNIGSADGAYLRHITTHYYNLAQYISFTKGYVEQGENRNEWRACPPTYLIEGLSRTIRRLLQNSSVTVSAALKKAFYCCNDVFVSNHLGFYPTFKYKRKSYPFTRQINRTVPMHFYKGYDGTLQDWYQELFDNKRIIRSFFKTKNACYKGYFSTTRLAIQKHPLYVYQTLHAQQRYAGEEIDHYIERTWKALLETPHPITCEK